MQQAKIPKHRVWVMPAANVLQHQCTFHGHQPMFKLKFGVTERPLSNFQPLQLLSVKSTTS